MEASYYTKLDEEQVKCLLCPHHCVLSSGEKGKCLVRSNKNGILYADVYGELSAIHIDPVEKKPLYHFHPGHQILSLGSLGCNFSCSCCQNYSISQSGYADFPRKLKVSSREIIDQAKRTADNIGIAFTYNEPGVWFEYMHDIAIEAKSENLVTAMVSNGYVNTKPLRDLLTCIDAFNIDVKSFNPKIHMDFTGGELKPVLSSLSNIAANGNHLEITMLLVPEVSDDEREFEKMVHWIANELGKDVPLHISRYFPNFKMQTQSGDPKILKGFAEIASDSLSYVYIGNFTDSSFQNTDCPKCKSLVISRRAYMIKVRGLNTEGACMSCGYSIAKL